VVVSQEGNFDDDIRNLLRGTLRSVDRPGQGPVTRRAAIAVLHDLGRNIANAYHWHHRLLAIRHDGEVDTTTERAIAECIEVINNPWLRCVTEVQRAWNRKTSAMVMCRRVLRTFTR
jgi:hypothetical protein